MYTVDTCANSSHVAELLDEADVIIHRAAAAGIGLIVASPLRTIETNDHHQVQDVVVALTELTHDEQHHGAVYNVGSTDEISIVDRAERAVETRTRSPQS